METKEQIRERMKAAREALGESGRREAGKVATERLLALPAFQSASEIYCYLDFGTEVPTGEILREAWRRHKRVWAPRVQGRQIRFYPVTSTGKLYPGVFGIPEPEEGIEGAGREGLAIVPGLAFDEHFEPAGDTAAGFLRSFSCRPSGTLPGGAGLRVSDPCRAPGYGAGLPYGCGGDGKEEHLCRWDCLKTR